MRAAASPAPPAPLRAGRGRRAPAPPPRRASLRAYCRSAPASAPPAAVSDRTRRLLASVAGSESGAGGAGGGTTLAALERADAVWSAIRNMRVGPDAPPAPPPFVTESPASTVGAASSSSGTTTYDVAVCGGTLGILLACALQARGQRVVVVERGPLVGRDQEWNISRAELETLVPLGVLTQAQADRCVTGEFNPIRCGFYGSETPPMVTRDVLNAGVKPAVLVATVRENFEALGGVVHERTALTGLDVRADGVVLEAEGGFFDGGSFEGGEAAHEADDESAEESPSEESSGDSKTPGDSKKPTKKAVSLSARLVVDCMGFGSPIVRQVRHGQKPDGVCLVVGSCARGFAPDENVGADLIYTASDICDDYRGQYFWEAFPAGSGPGDRTTYMFTYVDADPSRPSLAECLDDYWDLMPRYQGLASIEEVELLRVLFGYFPTYKDSPLASRFDRITAVGDASGMQSPLSFGGLAAILRHLGRLTDAMEDALLTDALDRECLASVNQYQPALSASWLFQRCMSVAPGAKPPKNFINRLMGINFGVMESLGEEVSRPFLQDVVTFGGLGKTLATMAAREPAFVPQILLQAGPGPILEWFAHFAALGAYDVLARLFCDAGPLAPLARAIAGEAPTGDLVRGRTRDGKEAVTQTEWGFAVLDARERFVWRRRLDAWKWGSGRDYHRSESKRE